MKIVKCLIGQQSNVNKSHLISHPNISWNERFSFSLKELSSSFQLPDRWPAFNRVDLLLGSLDFIPTFWDSRLSMIPDKIPASQQTRLTQHRFVCCAAKPQLLGYTSTYRFQNSLNQSQLLLLMPTYCWLLFKFLCLSRQCYEPQMAFRLP